MAEQALEVLVPTRQCARCREVFADTDADGSPVLAEWWACDPCRSKLLPGPARTKPVRP